MIEIGENIRALREIRGLTQKQLADASGIAISALKRLERGDLFSTNKLAEIARALNARVTDIDPRFKEDFQRLEGHLALVPERLKQARERAGYSTAAKASEALGIAYGTYSGHENGQRGIKGLDLARYAMFFKVTPGWLQFGRGTIDDLVLMETEPLNQQAQIKKPANDVAISPSSALSSSVCNADSIQLSNINAFAPEDEIIAAFDGVLDGYGIPTDRRSKLIRIFASALAEPVAVSPGRDRAMARRAIASALARALQLEEENRL